MRTVFGFGGAYGLTGTFVVAVLFTRETIARGQAERFLRLTAGQGLDHASGGAPAALRS